MKTYSQKPAEVERKWYVVDAATMPLGKLATVVADKLTGKSKPTYTPHVDGGDFVIVTNARHLVVTGNKLTGKRYYRHTGYPGGIKDLSLQEMLEKHPERVIEHAVAGMLPKNKLAAGRMQRLHVYAEAEHNHAAQKPIALTAETENK